MRRFGLGIVLAASMGAAALAQQQPPVLNNTQDLFFSSTTFAQMDADLAKATQGSAGPTYFNTAPESRKRLVVNFTSQSRPLDAAELDYIQKYATRMGKPNYAKAFTRAFLFKADGQDHWLPVQNGLTEFFTKEVKDGDSITLYLLESGGAKKGAGWAWSYLVEDFKAPKK